MAANSNPLLNHPRYERVKTLGSGSFGTVLLCKDKQEDRMVAIKMLNRGIQVLDGELKKRNGILTPRASCACLKARCWELYCIVGLPVEHLCTRGACFVVVEVDHVCLPPASHRSTSTCAQSSSIIDACTTPTSSRCVRCFSPHITCASCWNTPTRATCMCALLVCCLVLPHCTHVFSAPTQVFLRNKRTSLG